MKHFGGNYRWIKSICLSIIRFWVFGNNIFQASHSFIHLLIYMHFGPPHNFPYDYWLVLWITLYCRKINTQTEFLQESQVQFQTKITFIILWYLELIFKLERWGFPSNFSMTYYKKLLFYLCILFFGMQIICFGFVCFNFKYI